MNTLQVPLVSVEDHGLKIDTTVPGDQLRPEGVAEFPVGPVTVKGTLSPSGHEYIFFGAVTGTITAPCDRCLEDTVQEFESEVTWTFVEGAPESRADADEEVDSDDDFGDEIEDDTVIPFDGQTIDLLPTVWEEVMLAVPAKVLCEEDCAGLCPKCGANLNRTNCGCVVAPEEDMLLNKGLAGLKELLPKLKPGPLED
ncbi:MAG: DUF177 domain-containing protein [Candidatus Hydrogenedentes bacterium]|nr:DUF177 domain-containing protein [Candidatus Hydrogenedentota bacterium]